MPNLYFVVLNLVIISVLHFNSVKLANNDEIDPFDDYVNVGDKKFVWDYGTGTNGVMDWPNTCSTGLKQSPIDIASRRSIAYERVCPFVFNGYNARQLNLKLKNKWHSLYFWKIVKEGTRLPFLTGGGLPGDDEFEFVAGHFHWASTNDKGSEHHVDSDDAPLELHLVHWNRAKGKNPQDAIATNSWNALAVLGIKYDIGKHNKDLEPLFNAMDLVHEAGNYTYLKEKLPLKALLPRGTGSFFRYNGSLTTPPCNEVVVWTVFKDREYISQEQMNKLRAARSGEDRRRQLENNYRPAQPLNGRIVQDIVIRNYGSRWRKNYCSRKHHAKQSRANPIFLGHGITFCLIYFPLFSLSLIFLFIAYAFTIKMLL